MLAYGKRKVMAFPLGDMVGTRRYDGMSINWYTILYIMMALAWALRSCSGGHWSWTIMPETLLVVRYSEHTILAAFLCTISNLLMLSAVGGSQMTLAYCQRPDQRLVAVP